MFDLNNSPVSCNIVQQQPHADSEITSDPLAQLTEQLPLVLDELQKAGLADLYLKFNKLICEKTFPLDNIAFLLFLDVVKFYSCETSTQMRYSNNVKTFWVAGYKLFHGKFLRFMGGLKSRGLETERKGSYDPADAHINFAVPHIQSLESVNKSLLSGDVEPGVLTDVLDIIAKNYTGEHQKSMKLCFDGKKINSSLTKEHGDVNLFGCEDSPTLNEQRERLKSEVDVVERLIDTAQRMTENVSSHCSKTSFVTDVNEVIRLLSLRIKELRQMVVTKDLGVSKFKTLGMPDWRKSKYQYVISSLQTSLFQLGECINSCLSTIDRLGAACADMRNAGYLYRLGGIVDLNKQENFVCLRSDDIEINRTKETEKVKQHILKQRSEQWHQLRKSVKVTGSTIYNAIGLRSLKAQTEHFDSVINEQAKTPPTAETQKRMDYGTQHEIDAIATLVGKVLPVYHPKLCYVEEGCYDIRHEGNTFCIVSPDGSGRKHPQGDALLAFEIKCPYPDKKYKTQQLYDIPIYYSTQLLSEMVALQCSDLLFICYTEQSTTVFKVIYSDKAWASVWTELLYLYGSDTSGRPKKKRDSVKILKQMLEQFVRENVTFLCEVPSSRAVPCVHSDLTGSSPFLQHVSIASGARFVNAEPLPQILFKAKKCLQEASELCRRRATEVFVFLMSDLDRVHNSTIQHALPVAYGLQGPSLNTRTVRKMINVVLNACHERDIDVKAYSCDGQWIGIIHTNSNGKPLTTIQNQKQYWETVRKLSKGDILRFLEDVNVIPDTSNIDSVKTVVSVDIITSKKGMQKVYMSPCNCHYVFHMKKGHMTALSANKKDQKCVSQEPIDHKVLEILPTDLKEKVDNDVYEEIITAVKSLMQDGESETDDMDDASEMDKQTVSTPNEDETIVLNDADIKCLLSALSSDEKVTKQTTWKMSTHTSIIEKLSTAQKIYEHFSLTELKVCIRVLKQLYPRKMKDIMLSSTKTTLVNACAKKLGSSSTFLAKSLRKQKHVRARKCPTLKQIALRRVRQLPKQLLNIVYAEMTYPSVLREWRDSFPFTSKCTVNESEELEWYSFPDVIAASGCTTSLFGVVDAHHIFTNLRAKCCSSGMLSCGIRKEAWLSVAKESRTNGSGLSLAHVQDLIDRRSNAFAKKTFSEEVEHCMRQNGDFSEANFCRLVRRRYEGEDEASLSSTERLRSRLDMRQWLLSLYDHYAFPPPGMYVKGVPIVTYEALLTNIERKIQLYPYVSGGTYNPRAVSTLDAENFFSLFEDLHPTGGSTLKPEHVQKCMRTACQLMAIRFDPDRQVKHMETPAIKQSSH